MAYFLANSKDEVLKLFENTWSEKASGVDNSFERFLKTNTDVSTLPMLQICNHLLKCFKFLLDGEIENHYKRKGHKKIQETIDALHFCHLS